MLGGARSKDNATKKLYLARAHYECLDFLVNCDLVQEFSDGKRRSYDITDSGLKALKLVQEIDKSFHVFNVT